MLSSLPELNRAPVADTSYHQTILVLGDSDPAVLELQKLLQHWSTFSGYTSNTDTNLLTGYFDMVVRCAVERFQSAMFLQPDGVVGVLTWKALYTGAPASMPVLSLGSIGIEVNRLQRLLIATQDLSLNNLIGGSFDQNTEQAVRNFQLRSGLVIDGVVGAQTWYALSRIQH